MALDVLRDIVSRTNVYINSRNVNANMDVSVVERVARWVGEMLRIFGLGEGEVDEIGWGTEMREGEGSVNVSHYFALDGVTGNEYSLQREEILMPYLRSLSSFRDGVRKVAIDSAKSGNSADAIKEILALCDKLRDTDLVPLGVALDDQEGVPLVNFLGMGITDN